jgi:hypothetical protein
MSDLKEYTTLISSIIIALGAISTALIYVLSNKNNVSSTVIDNYKTLDAQKTQQIKDLNTAVEEIKATMRATEKGFIERIAKLEGQLKEKDNQIVALNKLLVERPELETVLGDIKDFMAGIYAQNQHQTKILERSQTRNEGIDAATEHETGNILRKE